MPSTLEDLEVKEVSLEDLEVKPQRSLEDLAVPVEGPVRERTMFSAPAQADPVAAFNPSTPEPAVSLQPKLPPPEYFSAKASLQLAKEINAGRPEKIQPFQERFDEVAAQSGVGVVTDKTLQEAATTPLVEFSDLLPDIKIPEGTTVFGVPSEGMKVVSGVTKGAASLLDFFTSPLGIATLGLSKLPASAQRIVAGVFAGQMASDLPELTAQALVAINQGDTEGAAKFTTQGIATLGFTAGAARHAIKGPKAKSPVPERPESIEKQLVLTADPNSTKATTHITPGSPTPTIPEGLVEVPVPGNQGTVIVNPAKADPQAVAAKAATGEQGIELGFSQATKPEGNTVVQTKKDGVVVLDEVVSPDGVEAATKAHQAAVPGGETTVTTAEKVIEERQATPSEAAVVKTSKSVNDFVLESQSLGIKPEFIERREVVQDIPITEVDLKSVDQKVEARWQDARLAEKSIWQRIKDNAVALKDSFTRHFPDLDPKQDGQTIEILRQYEAVPNLAQMEAAQVLRGITAGLGPRKYNVFSRLVILPDILKDIDRGLFEGKDLPFGYTSRESIQLDLDRFSKLAERFPDIKDAVGKRKEFILTLRDELVERGLLPEAVKDYEDYFHRQILYYANLKDSVSPGTSSSEVRMKGKSWQKKREGSAKDFNTSYIQSEFQVVSQALSQMATQDALGKIKTVSDIKPQLEAAAKALKEEDPSGQTTWQNLIPEDHTIWQPEKGNVFYRANSITDRILEDYLKGLRVITEEDIRQVLAKGPPKEQWVIPKRLAQTLDDFKPPKDSVAERIAAFGINRWKQWTLLNPERVIRYNVNNMSGDLDIAIAYDPGILKYSAKASKDLFDYVVKKKAPNEEILDATKRGVIGSGFSVQEVPELSRHSFFEVLEGKRPNLLQRYWRTVKDYTQWREDVLRLSAYRRFQDEIKAGKVKYGASKKSEIDAISDPKDRAAKLARELIGDYGNISVGGQWLRSKMIPFYSWMEINAPRYVRLFKNIPHEGKGVKEFTMASGWTLGRKASGLAIKASALMMLANLWNKGVFPDEEEELGDSRNQLHLILGRREDGSIISLRFQGALSDALSWFGGEDIGSDVKELMTGKASLAEKAIEAVKAPINKIVLSARPIEKSLFEALTKRSLYPNVFKPMPVRDPGQHIAKTFSLGTIYDYLTDKPKPDGQLLKLVAYSTDPGEAAYYVSRGLVADWFDKEGKERPSIFPDKKANALYYHKQAIKYGDEKLATKWKDRYFELGGTKKGLKLSVIKSAPLGSISKKDRNEFLEELTEKEKTIILRAEDWYHRTYTPPQN